MVRQDSVGIYLIILPAKLVSNDLPIQSSEEITRHPNAMTILPRYLNSENSLVNRMEGKVNDDLVWFQMVMGPLFKLFRLSCFLYRFHSNYSLFHVEDNDHLSWISKNFKKFLT